MNSNQFSKIESHVFSNLWPHERDYWTGIDGDVNFYNEVLAFEKILKNEIQKLKAMIKSPKTTHEINGHIYCILRGIDEAQRQLNILFECHTPYTYAISKMYRSKPSARLKRTKLNPNSYPHDCAIYVHKLCMKAELEIFKIKQQLILNHKYSWDITEDYLNPNSNRPKFYNNPVDFEYSRLTKIQKRRNDDGFVYIRELDSFEKTSDVFKSL